MKGSSRELTQSAVLKEEPTCELSEALDQEIKEGHSEGAAKGLVENMMKGKPTRMHLSFAKEFTQGLNGVQPRAQRKMPQKLLKSATESVKKPRAPQPDALKSSSRGTTESS